MTPEQIANKIRNHLDTYQQAGYIFDHIVLGDFNINKKSIEYCLGEMPGWFANEIEKARQLDGDYIPPSYQADLMRLTLATYDLLNELWRYDEATLSTVHTLLQEQAS